MKHFILILAAIVFSTGLSLAQTQDSTSAVLQENLPETQMTKKEIRKAAMPEQRNEITIGYGWGTFIDATFIHICKRTGYGILRGPYKNRQLSGARFCQCRILPGS